MDARDRRGPPGVRRDRLVHRPRAAQRCLQQLQDALRRASSEALAPSSSPRSAAPVTHHLRAPARRAARRMRCSGRRRPSTPSSGSATCPIGDAFGSAARAGSSKEPVGVVGAIIPWNFPLEVTLNKLGQALATGNTVVLKPAPDTPWNATRLGRLIAEQTDIPAGVVNVVTSSDNAVGEQLVIDPRVDLISFTGSTAVGRRIMAEGAATLKRVFLELGGKSAKIVLDDVDLDARGRRRGVRRASTPVRAARC